jgi:hypothetical protein
MFTVKMMLFRTSRPISIKLGSNHSLVEEIQNWSNKRPGPLHRGDNDKNAKIRWNHLKILSRTTYPENLRFT